MKIAFVGKGGSGKSSISWLTIKALESLNRSVLAIDADHNMDLTSNLGIDFETMNLMCYTDKQFAGSVNHDLSRRWSDILTNTDNMNKFTLNPKDEYTKIVAKNISHNLDLITVGLGDANVLFAGKCSHGLSSPLKYYLGMLDEGDTTVVIDSVAGVDMINFGLYAGADAIVCSVEPANINSYKVYKQIKDICKKTFMKVYVVINKKVDNDVYRELVKEDVIIGEIPIDTAILNYDYDKVSDETKQALDTILENILKLDKKNNFEGLKKFQEVKTGTV